MGVWTEHQLAEFLRFVGTDRLYARWWLIGLRRLRRGEAAGLRWVDVDLDGRAVTICVAASNRKPWTWAPGEWCSIAGRRPHLPRVGRSHVAQSTSRRATSSSKLARKSPAQGLPGFSEALAGSS